MILSCNKIFFFLSVAVVEFASANGDTIQNLSEIETKFNCLDNCTVILNSTISDDCFQLTDDFREQTGVVWTADSIETVNSFTIDVAMYFGSNDSNASDPGADGIALVVQSVGPNVSGSVGGGIGYSGITPSLGVEFDTYRNTNEPLEDHVALVEDGRLNNGILAGPHPLMYNLEDGAYHNISFSWEGDNDTVKVTVDGVLVVNHTSLNLSNILNASFAYIGFTSSTGYSSNVHEVCIKSIRGTLYSSESPSVSVIPSISPSKNPSFQPSSSPTSSTIPSIFPSKVPTFQPSSRPSFSSIPSQEPSNLPSITLLPSPAPSSRPSVSILPSSAPSCKGKKKKDNKRGKKKRGDDEGGIGNEKNGKKFNAFDGDCLDLGDDDDDDDDGSSVPGTSLENENNDIVDDDYVEAAFRFESLDTSVANGFGKTSLCFAASSFIIWLALGSL